MTVKERLILFVRHKKMSIRKFELTCGLSLGYINNIRVSIQPDKVTRIADCFPDLNTGWLMTGEGEMLKNGYSFPGFGSNLAESPPVYLDVETRLKNLENCCQEMNTKIEELKESNLWYRKTIDSLLNKKNQDASDAPAADAECVAAG
jgi:hypothetical protein